VSAPAGSPLPDGKPLNVALADDYAQFPDPIPAILRQTPASEIIRTDLWDLTPLKHWSQGRVVLLGDAAHAMTPNLGQGGAQAIEDAWVLAAQLAAHADPAEAIAAYERLRRERVTSIVRQAADIGRVAHLRNPWLQWIRNALLRMTGTRMNRRQFDDLYTLRY
jgi:2-polyprenyl-6-methoxyphenol hydroxylase-like FAD-dependent oxidoreductase